MLKVDCRTTSYSNQALGQSIAEYAILIAVVTAAVTAMQVYAKRGIQAAVKVAADEMSPFGAADSTGEQAQVEGMRYESGERRNRSVAVAGAVLTKESATATDVQRSIQTGETIGGGRSTPSLSESTTTTGAVAGRGTGVSAYSEVIVEMSN